MSSDTSKLSPGELPACDKCCATLRQCMMATSCIPPQCPAWAKHEQETKNDKNV